MLPVLQYIHYHYTAVPVIVVDRHHIDADLGPNPTFNFDADPDPSFLFDPDQHQVLHMFEDRKFLFLLIFTQQCQFTLLYISRQRLSVIIFNFLYCG